MMPMLSFAVEDATGKSHLFPQWWGAFGAMSRETVINGVTHTSRRRGGPETDIPAFKFEKVCLCRVYAHLIVSVAMYS